MMPTGFATDTSSTTGMRPTTLRLGKVCSQTIGRVEKFGVFINHADTLRRMWSEWLIEQKRRDDERGW